MVDAHHVEQPRRTAEAADPPAVAVLPHPLPVVERVTPELAVLAERVRRTPGHRRGAVLPVELELLRLRPDVGRIQRHIDRQIADQTNAKPVHIVAQRVPLAEKHILYVGKQPHIVRQQRPIARHGLRTMQTKIRVRPLRPRQHIKMALERHEQRVVREPRVCLGKPRNFRRIPRPAVLARLPQEAEAVVVQLAVVHTRGIIAPIDRVQLRSGEQALLRKQLQIDQIGISRKGGKALVRRIAVPGRPDGKQLPIALSRCLEKIRKRIRSLAQRPDAVFGRQRGDRQQHAAASLYHQNRLLFRFCFFPDLE